MNHRWIIGAVCNTKQKEWCRNGSILSLLEMYIIYSSRDQSILSPLVMCISHSNRDRSILSQQSCVFYKAVEVGLSTHCWRYLLCVCSCARITLAPAGTEGSEVRVPSAGTCRVTLLVTVLIEALPEMMQSIPRDSESRLYGVEAFGKQGHGGGDFQTSGQQQLWIAAFSF